jgi:carbonic anhydrase/acetyltransferase-like protein (isoleucine patch superfamily)
MCAVTRLQPVVNAGYKVPKVASTSWIAPSAQVSGDVKVGENCSIWYNCAVRGAHYLRSSLRASLITQQQCQQQQLQAGRLRLSSSSTGGLDIALSKHEV